MTLVTAWAAPWPRLRRRASFGACVRRDRGVHAKESGALCHSRQKCDVLVISLLARLDACIVRQSLARVPFFRERKQSHRRESVWCASLLSFPPSRPFGVMSPSPCRVTLHVAWPVSGLGGPFGPFFLYSDYYVLVTVYVILGRDPRRWGLIVEGGPPKKSSQLGF